MPMRYAVRRWPPPPTAKPKLVRPARLDVADWVSTNPWIGTAAWGPDVIVSTVVIRFPARGLIMRGRR